MKTLAKVLMVCWLVASGVHSQVADSSTTQVSPDGSTSDSMSSSSPPPEATSPSSPAPEATSPSSPAPEATSPSSPAPEATSPSSPAPEATSPSSPAPDTTSPSSPAPDTTSPSSPAPDTTSPSSPAPEVTSPSSPAPEVTSPSSPAPEVTSPSSPAPDTTSPSSPAPEVTSPSSPAPDTTSPSSPAPDTTSPSSPAPDTTSPSSPAPDTTSPSSPAPDTTSPSSPAPEVTSPSSPAPEVTSPSSPAPDTTSPSSPAPDTTSPTPVEGTTTPVTVSPNSPNTAETSTPDASTPPTVTARPDPCMSNPCPVRSRCEPRFDNYTCVCFTGLVLQDNVCKEANVFPAEIRVFRNFTQAMADKTSEEFKKTSDEIVAELQSTLNNNTEGYITSIVFSLREGSVIANVQNIYSPTSTTTATAVNKAFVIAASCTGCLFAGATLTDTKLCSAPDACDPISTTCSEKDGKLNCECKSGYVKTNFTDRSCVVCPSGSKAKNNECVSCSFGYSGVNCQESYMLAVVVVSCVLGGLLLILLIVLIVICCRKSKKGSASPAKSSPYVEYDFRNRTVPKIPRANANSKGWEPANLELVESGSTRALVMPDHQSNGMKNFGNQNMAGIAYRTHGHINPYFQSNEGH
ncbi:mucin-13-like isoform X2 [Alosa sapidissima]|uniref:mucin-13-like isoform X2 n=1 Tax=Alosa sapidissima TaxID=34773 RepID=UPI001C0A2270|nr:mucin-13-like isoform X2 [Alosa sapidissima]